MVPLHATRTRRSRAIRCAAALLWLLTLTAAAQVVAAPPGPGGVAPPDNDVYCWKDKKFRIPIADGVPGQGGIKQVNLYVSEDYGKSYRFVSKAENGQTYFSVVVGRDGLYFFALQIQSQDGRNYPNDMSQVQPALKVLVDNVPPDIKINRTAPREGTVALDWTISDACPDTNTLRGFHRPAGSGQKWEPFDVPKRLVGPYGWTPSHGGPIEVYLEMTDKAGNVGRSNIETLTPSGAGNPQGPGPGPGPNQGRLPDTPRGDYLLINKTVFSLPFDVDEVGKSGIAEIEVWMRREGKPWELKRELGGPGKKSPLEIKVEGEGRYGITLIAVSGVGERYERPGENDAPQVTVEVDTTPPNVKILGAPVVGRDKDAGKMTIKYIAVDANKNLGPTPIKISYALAADGPTWTTVADNLANDGVYVWNMPPEGLPLRFYVRVDAVDLAGNLGSAVTAQPVNVDLVKPKIRPRLEKPGAGPSF